MPALKPARGRIPASRTRLIGRDDDRARLHDLVLHSGERLWTLTGVGGCGKTRLALQVATDLMPQFPERVWFVELAPTDAPALVLGVVADALGITTTAERAPQQAMIELLSKQPALVVLDNCEHLLAACAALADTLLATCPRLRILATSREPLQITGERQYGVLPLATPDGLALADLDRLGATPAVRLFVERAQAVVPDFVLTANNAGDVARICTQLAGIPLALELAAARTRVLSPQQIEEWIDRRLWILTSGNRGGPTRHQTLRATIEWSDAMLSAAERTAFHRAAIFPDEFTLEAAEAVCGDDDDAVATMLDTISQLVDKSLLVVQRGEAVVSYRVLEPIRQFGLERLKASGEFAATAARLGAFCFAMAERASIGLEGKDQEACVTYLERHHADLRIGLEWGKEQAALDRWIQVCVALTPFWEIHGHFAEGLDWLQAALSSAAMTNAADSKPWILASAGRLALFYYDGPDSRHAEAEALYAQSLDIFQQLDNQPGIATALTGLGIVQYLRGDFAHGAVCLRIALAVARESAYLREVAQSLQFLGGTMRRMGSGVEAVRLLEESVDCYRKLGDAHMLGWTLMSLALAEIESGSRASAAEHLKESILTHARMADWWQVTNSIITAARVLTVPGQQKSAKRLRDALQTLTGPTDRPIEEIGFAQLGDLLMAHMSSAGLAAADADASSISLEQAVSVATDAISSELSRGPERTRPAVGGLLTEREWEIAKLLARGQSDREIAGRLFISAGTVGVHVHHILQKTNLKSRGQVGEWLRELDHSRQDSTIDIPGKSETPRRDGSAPPRDL